MTTADDGSLRSPVSWPVGAALGLTVVLVLSLAWWTQGLIQGLSASGPTHQALERTRVLRHELEMEAVSLEDDYGVAMTTLGASSDTAEAGSTGPEGKTFQAFVQSQLQQNLRHYQNAANRWRLTLTEQELQQFRLNELGQSTQQLQSVVLDLTTNPRRLDTASRQKALARVGEAYEAMRLSREQSLQLALQQEYALLDRAHAERNRLSNGTLASTVCMLALVIALLLTLRRTLQRPAQTLAITEEHQQSQIQGLRNQMQQLEQEHEHSERAMEVARVGYWYSVYGLTMIDDVPTWKLQYLVFSDRACEILGMVQTPDKIHLPGPVRSFREQCFSPEDFQRMDELLRSIHARERDEYQLELAAHRPTDGAQRWIKLAGRVQRDEAGRVLHIDGMVKDISDSQRLAEAQQHARDMAEAATRLKSDFLANMSHEIRTPLNAILGMTHLAMDQPIPERAKHYLGRARGAASTLMRIINDVLDLSKLESGMLTVETLEFDLDEVLGQLIALFAEKADEKSLQLYVDVGDDVPYQLMGDPLRLLQILTNLCSNAIKFTDHGSVMLTIRTLSHTGSGVRLQFNVADTGVGISEQGRERLFQAFSQADNSITRRYGGTGLGLAISRQLVQTMGGDIHVQSQAGVGSSFQFELPLGCPTSPNPENHLKNDLANLCIWLVDPDAQSMRIETALARRLGLKVVQQDCVEDCLQALVQAHRARLRPDVVVVDCRIQDERCQDIEQLMTTLWGENPPALVVVTPHNPQLVERRFAQRNALGIGAILQKPLTLTQLQNGLRAALGKVSLMHGTPKHDIDAMAKSLQGIHLLVVEDNDVNQELVAELLRRVGIRCTIANNGAEALERLHSSQQGDVCGFDGVLMDCQMPVMDGYRATSLLRQNPQWQQLPVLALTAHALRHEREQALSCGMNDHIAKPIEPARLYAALHRWVVHRPVPISSAASTNPATNPMPQPTTDTPQPTPDAAQEPPNPSAPEMPGWDQSDALRRVGGNTVVYGRMLQRFERSLRQFLPQVTEALQRQDWPAATVLCHTQRGAAAHVGATALQQACQALEGVLSQAPQSLNHDATLAHCAPWAQVQLLVNTVLDQLAPPVHDAPDSLAGIAHDLLQCLRTGDTRALELARQLVLRSAPGEQHEQALQVQESVLRFQFDQARGPLQTLLDHTATPVAS